MQTRLIGNWRAATLTGALLAIACSSGASRGIDAGQGQGGTPAGSGGGSMARDAGAGGTGATGSGGAAGFAVGAGGGGGARSTTDAGAGSDAAGSWSCVNAVGTLCFCSFGNAADDGGVSSCGTGWSCCFSGSATSCECTPDDEAGCAAIVATDPRLHRVDRCPAP